MAVPGAPAVVLVGILSCALLRLGNIGAVVEVVEVSELVGLLKRLKPPGAVEGDATGLDGADD